MKKLLFVLLTALLLTSGAAFAQGTITDGAASWSLNAFGTNPGVDFTGVGTGDCAFEAGWWFREDAGAFEVGFPAPDGESYVGDTATLDWTDLTGTGVAAQLVDVVIDGGGPSGNVGRTLTLTNNATAAATINIYHYVDFDVAGSFGDDSATLVNPNDYLMITDGGTPEFAEMRAVGGDNYQVIDFSNLRAILNDGSADDLDNTGAPFGPDDYTGAFQWQSVTIPGGGGTAVFETWLSCNEMALPV